jgi:peptidoglycan/xylan/chitin deacetylase (PgdA/CDA1 family)
MRLIPALLVLLLALPAHAQTVSILTYHRFNPDRAPGATTVTTRVFAGQMDRIAALGLTVIPLRALFDGTKLPDRAVAITADDGHRSVFSQMYPILKAHRFPATLFLNPPSLGRGANLRWEELTEMQASGLIDCEPHTMSHPDFRAERDRRTPSEFAAFLKRELEESRRILADRLGGRQDLLAWPYGIHDAALEAAAQAAGYRAAFALGGRAALPGSPAFAVPRYQVYEADLGPGFDAILAGRPRAGAK